MAYKVTDNLSIENARIIFRNFKGEESRYNHKGDRNFCIIIEDATLAKKLIEDGWNIRILAPREEDEDPRYYIQVSVSYKGIPPKIFMICGKTKTLLDEDTVESLDWADISSADVIIRPYNWEIKEKDGVKTGVKAYLKNMYVVIEQDEFADKYNINEGPNEDYPF